MNWQKYRATPMGVSQSLRRDSLREDVEVSLDDFEVLRAIGKGSFGKVCIVQMRRSKKMYAMKYMNKEQCKMKEAIRNVTKEVEILSKLNHIFLVNLWFSFQDAEDMFMVVDLLLGGDLRYHLQQNICFPKEDVTLYLCEIAAALDYLKIHSIVHRDVKPENLLLDAEGHVHLTDFNIATKLSAGQKGNSISGTKPYMAPEVYQCAAVSCNGYGLAIDWWSLGVCIYELATGARPFDIHSVTTPAEALEMMKVLEFPEELDGEVRTVIQKLLEVDETKRITSSELLVSYPLAGEISWTKLSEKNMEPHFLPSRDRLNCDPILELEEMIIEARPLHKKKKRLSKQRSCVVSARDLHRNLDEEELEHGKTIDEDNYIEEFPTYNREKEITRLAKEAKENAWEEELLLAMAASSSRCVQAPSNNPSEIHFSTNKTVSPLDVKARIAGSIIDMETLNFSEIQRGSVEFRTSSLSLGT